MLVTGWQLPARSPLQRARKEKDAKSPSCGETCLRPTFHIWHTRFSQAAFYKALSSLLPRYENVPCLCPALFWKGV